MASSASRRGVDGGRSPVQRTRVWGVIARRASGKNSYIHAAASHGYYEREALPWPTHFGT